MKRVEMIGKIFGKWKVVFEAEKRNNKRAFMCVCECGNERVVLGDNLRNGTSTQCASCSSKIKGGMHGTHGHTYNRLYHVWRGMKRRCYVTTDPGFKHYGGKGVIVCVSWKDNFENFYRDMGDPPSDKHQIDRIDFRGNYTLDNCRWVLPSIQQRNKSNNKKISYLGVEKTESEWARDMGLGLTTLRWRLRRGWSVKEALTTPVRKMTFKAR